MQYRSLKRILFIFPFVFFQFFALSQGLNNFETIYDDDSLKLELEIIEGHLNNANDCNKNFFKYRLTGKLLPTTKYLIWRIEYQDCDGNNYYKEFSYQIGILGTSLDLSSPLVIESPDNYFFEAIIYDKSKISSRISQNDDPQEGIIESKLSITPKEIIGERDIKYGQSVLLTVKGGLLGTNGRWVWYEGECGNQNKKIGEGSSIMYMPKNSSIISVRGEGDFNLTDCILHPIYVDLNSQNPLFIECSETSVCEGSEVSLSIIGGELGYNAQWIWYVANIEKPQQISKIGFGRNINIKVKNSSIFYARAESEVNFTDFVKKEVIVNPLLTSPFNLSISKEEPCQNELIDLTITGVENLSFSDFSIFIGSDLLSPDNIEKIDDNFNLKHKVGEKNEIIKLVCNYQCIDDGIEYEKTYNINVLKNIENPGSLRLEPEIVTKGVPFQLTATPKNEIKTDYTSAKWFKEYNCKSGFEIGSGNQINFDKIRKETEISFKAFGECNETDCINKSIIPIKGNGSINSRNTVALGLLYNSFLDLRNENFVLNEPIQFHGLSLTLKYELLKRLSKYVSISFDIGVLGGYSQLIGPGYKALTEWDAVKSTDNDLSGNGSYLGLNGGISFSLFGLLFSYQNNIVKHKFKTDVEFNDSYNIKPIEISYDNELTWETAGVGLRLFNRSGGRTDIQYTITQFNKFNFFKYEDFKNTIHQGIALKYTSNPSRKNSLGLILKMILAPNKSVLYSGISNFEGGIILDL